MDKYDAIVIGAGNGGLTAAAVLAKEGKKVLVAEKSHSPGGFATSFRRGRFEFDVSLHELCGFGRYDKPFGGVRQLFDYLGISDSIDWVDLPDAYRLISSDKDGKIDVAMPFGIDAYCNKLEEYVPGSYNGIRKLFGIGAENLQVLSRLGKCRSTAASVMELLKNREFLHFISKTLNDALSEIDMPERARDVFRGYWAYICADGDNLSFLHYMMMVNSYIELGSVIPRARSLEISNTFSEYIISHGGEIRLHDEVQQIIIENSKAVGIVHADGTKSFADYIVCNASPHAAFSKLIDSKYVPEDDLRRADFRTIAGRGFCVYLGLNASAEEIGLKDYTYFIFPDNDTVKQFKNMESPLTNRVQNTVCPNAVYKEASPEGTCILSMTTLFTSDWWGKVGADDYYKEKNKFADSMIDAFEQATGLDIRSHIEEIEIASPETFARFTCTPQGAIYGYLAKKNDGVLARQLTENARMSGIEGLYFIGGYGKKLNGYSSAMSTGFDAARHIIRVTEG